MPWLAPVLALLFCGSAFTQSAPPQITAPVNPADAANKGYVDTLASHGVTIVPPPATPPTVNLSYAGGGLTNGVLLGAGGNVISFCPALSCVTSPSTDHQRASALFWSTTADDGHSEEQTVAIETIIGTGASKPWAPNTAFAVGDNIRFGDARNAVYRATQAGLSASSGAGPSGTGSAITDGTVVWSWINASALDAKVGLYNETVVKPGAGSTWSQANNIQLYPGVVPSFNVNTEFDFTNNAADCNLGIANCNGLEISMAGAHRSTTGVHIGSQNVGPGYGAIWGIRLDGTFLASSATIEDDTGSPVGIGFGLQGLGSTAGHAIAAISDASPGASSYLVTGTKTSADFTDLSSSPAAFNNSGAHGLGTFVDTSASPVVLNVTGTHSAEVFNDASVSPSAISLHGTYSLAAITTANSTAQDALIVADGQRICFAATDACLVHTGGKLQYLVGGTAQFSVQDTTGNAVFRGTVTASGTP